MSEPTEQGKRRWPPDGYLRLNSVAGEPDRLACMCSATCQPDCKGECGCEACALAWLVYQDEQALWSDNGELLNVVDLRPDWQRVADPRQLRLRFDLNKISNEVDPSSTRSDSTEPVGSHKHHRSTGDSSMHSDREKKHPDISSSSVPPVLDTHRSRVPDPLEWQKTLPKKNLAKENKSKRKPASVPEDGEDEASNG